MTHTITESEVEDVALDTLHELGYSILHGPHISPESATPERRSYEDVILVERLRNAIAEINKDIPEKAQEEAVTKVLRRESPELITSNQRFHTMLTDGVDIEYRRKDGSIAGDKVWLVDFEEPQNNEFLAVNQFTIIENRHNRRPDIILFINGLPLAVIELKNPADENATITSAYNQLQTYKKQIPSLFVYNEALIVSDGLEARAGTITSKWGRFMPWKTIEGRNEAPTTQPQFEVLFKGMLDKKRLLDLIRHFIVFEDDGSTLQKKMAAYHQYHAVNKALESTHKAVEGDRRCGVVWHTQGSGKSLTMVFYTGKMVQTLNNPTIVVLTDRNDLDDQLFGTFSGCHHLLRQTPAQAESRDDLKEKLNVASGGIVFTTIQKFLPEIKGDSYPLLSDRKNIVVIADEAHRSQYDFIDGFARHMRDALPNASFIGFTGTPIELRDRNTFHVFGNYIDIYDIEQAVEDGSTVRIFYESRLAKLELDEQEKPKIDPQFAEVTEQEEVEQKEKLKSRWARMEAVVGARKRVGLIAQDIVKHFKQRLEAIDGKAMIVCMSRRICFDLYKEITKLKPDWHHDDDDKGIVKVIMTGSASDPVDWQPHIRNKQRRRKLGEQMKDPEHEMKIAIVRDMWLTGFDCPSLHTMYFDKPMKGHTLMQAIARVNRVYKDKKGGLIVDYLGIGHELKKALADYTESGGRGDPVETQEKAVAIMLEKYEVVSALFHGFDYSKFFTGTPKDRLNLLRPAADHVLGQPDGKNRCLKEVTALSQAFALAVPHPKTFKIRDDVGFFQVVRATIVKTTTPEAEKKSKEELDTAIKQIVSKAVATDKVIDIFDAVGLKKPDISILSPQFLAEVKGMPHKNLAFEVLKKLINDELRVMKRTNLVKSRDFSEMLEETIKKYHIKGIETAQIIEELIELSKQMNEARKRDEELNLTSDEIAFYDALEVNDSAVAVLGDEKLQIIARELVETIRNNVSIDWTLRESVQANMRVAVKRILRKHGYPPDKQKKATETVLEQAALLCENWAEV